MLVIHISKKSPDWKYEREMRKQQNIAWEKQQAQIAGKKEA
jgi:hypothetical protein